MEFKESKLTPLTAEQYHTLYVRAFARLADISHQAEQAMDELEELMMGMGENEH